MDSDHLFGVHMEMLDQATSLHALYLDDSDALTHSFLAWLRPVSQASRPSLLNSALSRAPLPRGKEANDKTTKQGLKSHVVMRAAGVLKASSLNNG